MPKTKSKSKAKSGSLDIMNSRAHRNIEQLVLDNLPTFSRSMTFAKMLEMDKASLSLMRKWPWFFPPICKRKDQATLTDIEKSRYICAFNMVNNDGTLGAMVDLHAGSYMQHGSLRLLPWHRIFLHLFEEALHRYHPDVCIPYWDWTKPSEQHFPDWLVGVLPTVHTPTRTINVIRSPGAESWLAGTVSGVPAAMGQTNYTDFTGPINGIHGGVHVWVGGTMSDPSTSPADPVFWLHHANLDRLWWLWYNSPAGGHQNPVIAGAISPWTYTEADTRNTVSLGYQYV